MGISRRLNILLAVKLTLMAIAFGNAQSAIPSSVSNATSRLMDNKLVQNIMSATEAITQLAKPAPAAPPPAIADQKMAPSGGNSVTIRDMLKMLEAQNAKFGDSCDTAAWTQHMKPIYDALNAGNVAEQDKRNNAFAMAILKDHSIISKVCLSAAHIMECAGGTCQCLSKLPADLKYASDMCAKASAENRSDGGAGGGGLAVVMGFIQNLFSFATGHSARCVGQVGTVLLSLTAVAAHYAMFKK